MDNKANIYLADRIANGLICDCTIIGYQIQYRYYQVVRIHFNLTIIQKTWTQIICSVPHKGQILLWYQYKMAQQTDLVRPLSESRSNEISTFIRQFSILINIAKYRIYGLSTRSCMNYACQNSRGPTPASSCLMNCLK